MYDRFTVRTFDTSQSVKEDDLKQIVEAGLLSPSQNFRYPWELLVLTDSEEGRRLSKEIWMNHSVYKGHCDEEGKPLVQYINSLRTAPVNIIVMAELKGLKLDDNNPEGGVDLKALSFREAMIPTVAMMLQAEQLGYKTAFTGVIDCTDECRKKLYPSEEEFQKALKKYAMVVLSIGKAERVYSKAEIYNFESDPETPIVNFECENEAEPRGQFVYIDVEGRGKGIVVGRNKGNVDRKVRSELVKFF